MTATSDIIQREFTGSKAEVTRCKNSRNVKISGRIIDETKNTFTLLHEGKRKIIVKDLAVFKVKLPNGAVFEIDGKLLAGRPEDRLKKNLRRSW